MKKLIALVLALALVLMVGAAFAANNLTITINNANPNQSYTVYKIFDATTNTARQAASDTSDTTEVTTSGINYTVPSGKSLATEYTYTDTAGTPHTVKGSDWFTTDAAGNVTAVSGANVATEAFREWAKRFGTAGETQTKSASDANSQLVFSGLSDGYYFISTTTGSLVTVTSIAPNALVKDKNGVPTLDKVEDQPTNDIDDTVTYTVTVHLVPGSKNVVFHDVLSAGLTLQGTAPTSIKVGSTDLVEGSDKDYVKTKWENTTTANTDDITLTFTQKYLDSLTTATDVTIVYSAKVNSNAVVNEHNDAYLKYGENNNIESEHKTVYESTFKFKVNKVDGSNSNAALNGAKFVLSTDGSLGDLTETLTDTQKASLLKFDASTGTQTQDVSATNYILQADNNITFNGLDGDPAGTIYYLYEVKAPEGYNKLTAPVAVKITPTMVQVAGTDTTEVASYVVSYKLPGEANFTNCGSTASFAIPQEFPVQNNQGTVLPSTGGIGTTIFYIVGGLLVIGAAVILVARRKAHE